MEAPRQIRSISFIGGTGTVFCLLNAFGLFGFAATPADFKAMWQWNQYYFEIYNDITKTVAFVAVAIVWYIWLSRRRYAIPHISIISCAGPTAMLILAASPLWMRLGVVIYICRQLGVPIDRFSQAAQLILTIAITLSAVGVYHEVGRWPQYDRRVLLRSLLIIACWLMGLAFVLQLVLSLRLATPAAASDLTTMQQEWRIIVLMGKSLAIARGSLMIVLVIILRFATSLLIRQLKRSCMSCGYDLRFQAGEMCPECGAKAMWG